MLVDVDRGQDVVADEALREDDRVLEVVTLPRHEGHEQVLAERELALIGGGTVGEDLALLDLVALDHARLLVNAGVLVRTLELEELVDLLAELLVLNGDDPPVELGDDPVVFGDDHVGRVARGAGLDAGAHIGGLGRDERYGLALHVGAHERTVRVVVLEEGDQRGRDRHDLLRRNVHELDLERRNRRDLGGGTEEHVTFELQLQIGQRGGLGRPAHQHAVSAEHTVGGDLGVGLRDDVFLFLVGGEPDDLVGDLALVDHAVRRLDKAERVHAGIGGERTDEADVRAFRGLDGAHAPVVREVDVTDLEAGPLARQTTRAERREATAVGEARQRVHLVHELRQLRRPEELLDRRDHRPDVDERLGRDGLDVLGGHALTNDAFHARQADAHLVLDELAHRTDAPVCEVVLIVEAVARLALGEMQQVRARGQHLGLRQHWLIGFGTLEVEVEQCRDLLDLGAELAVQLVPTDARQVVAARLEERVAEVGTSGLDRRRLARTGALVDLDEGLVLGGRGVAILLPLAFEEIEVAHEALEETRRVRLVVAQRTQQHEDRQATLAGHAGAGGDVTARLLLDVELDPLTAIGVDGAGHELVLRQVAQAEALARLEDDAR
ncbi:unannotated protein [freshwater metagenome]|uniref:Unannotated protein n=1 Tax=freshwater metagenome TaxID=449393 RepID=A0A6J6V5A9_9ZZZZ